MFGEAVSVSVGEYEFALIVEEDLQGAVVDVGVAGDTDPEYIVSQCRTALRIGDEMVEVQPDFVRTAGGGTAPSLAAEHFSLLSFGGVSVARIETDFLVLDR